MGSSADTRTTADAARTFTTTSGVTVMPGEGETLALSETEAEGEMLALSDSDALREGDIDALGLMLADAENEGL